MPTNTVVAKFIRLAAWIAAALLPAQAEPVIGPWQPIFQGIDYSVSTNLPTGGTWRYRQVVHTLRVDLSHPDIRLLTTPPIADAIPGHREIGGLTMSEFLQRHRVQAAINANFFSALAYYLPADTPMDVYGLAISEGVIVSTQESPAHAATFLFDAQNRATVVHTNWPAASTAGVFTAVTGKYPLVVHGRSIADQLPDFGRVHELNPRTAFGLSEDRRYLYLLTIDGRQPGYSDGAFDDDTANWLLLLGAHDGMNMDGGGSTTLVMQESTGQPRRLNRPSAAADSGRERTVGSHLGIYAKPLEGFVRGLELIPDERVASLRFQTTAPATAEVAWGTTQEFGRHTSSSAAPATEHQVPLTELQPATTYYYQVTARANGQTFPSPVFTFTTTFHATTNELFGYEQPWRFTATPQTGTAWTEPGYDDSSWEAAGPGVHWIDVSESEIDPALGPLQTLLPANPLSGYPSTAYYFRTRWALGPKSPAALLSFAARADDGAVFYWNGHEIYRLRMPDIIDADTLATGFPCAGNATCLDTFSVPMANLPGGDEGDAVLAVEVHNYNARSPDITFGLELHRIDPIIRAEPRLTGRVNAQSLRLTWEGHGFILQSAESLAGPWTDLAASTTSPFTVPFTAEQRYYRLRQ